MSVLAYLGIVLALGLGTFAAFCCLHYAVKIPSGTLLGSVVLAIVSIFSAAAAAALTLTLLGSIILPFLSL